MRAGDLGVHLFVAPTDAPVPGFSGRLVARLVAAVFADPSVQRLVVEPDIENDKSVALLVVLASSGSRSSTCPTRRPRLGFLDRTAYAAG